MYINIYIYRERERDIDIHAGDLPARRGSQLPVDCFMCYVHV